jgi:hypothetical protein
MGDSFGFEHVVMIRDNELSFISLCFFICDSHKFAVLHLLSDGWLGVLRVSHVLHVLLLDGLQLINNSIILNINQNDCFKYLNRYRLLTLCL